jgi:hypothetical protein
MFVGQAVVDLAARLGQGMLLHAAAVDPGWGAGSEVMYHTHVLVLLLVGALRRARQ